MEEIFECSGSEDLHLLNIVHCYTSPKAFSVFFKIYLKKRQLYGAKLNNNDLIPISIRSLMQNTNMGIKRVCGGIQELKDSEILSYTGEAREKRCYLINWDKIRELGQIQFKGNNSLQRMTAYEPSCPEHINKVNICHHISSERDNGKTYVTVQPGGKVTIDTHLGDTQSKIVNHLSVDNINLFVSKN